MVLPSKLFLASCLLMTVTDSLACQDSGSASCCNNVEGLCDVPVDDILFGMVHNAMSSPSHGFYVFANHVNDPIVASLDAGYRGLELDLCNCKGKMTLCHGGSQTGCGIGGRDPVETFQIINQWVEDHPNNVIMIWLQFNEEAGGPISLSDVHDIVNSVPVGTTSGQTFANRLYRRDRYSNGGWPTLAEMIQTQQQVLFFYKGGPAGSEEPPPGIHYFYEYGASNFWSYPSVSDLQNAFSTTCPMQIRSSNRNDFYLLSAYVTAKFFGVAVRPSRSDAQTINTGTFLRPIFDVCEASIGKKVSIVSVDFWDSGDLTSFVNQHNFQLVPTTGRSTPKTFSTAAVAMVDPPTSPSSLAPNRTKHNNERARVSNSRISGRVQGDVQAREVQFGG